MLLSTRCLNTLYRLSLSLSVQTAEIEELRTCAMLMQLEVILVHDIVACACSPTSRTWARTHV